MRVLSFILALALVLAGTALDVSAAQDNLPGVGTFAYSGSPIVSDAPSMVVVAVR
jgi:hypothetical protein